MNKIKEMIIRKSFKFKVTNIDKGIDIVKFDFAMKIKEEYSEYFYLLYDVEKIIDGINKIEFDIDAKEAKVYYDDKKIDSEKIIKMIDTLKKFIIENLDFISGVKENEIEESVEYMKNKFKDSILKL